MIIIDFYINTYNTIIYISIIPPFSEFVHISRFLSVLPFIRALIDDFMLKY